jgi:hypothetical protein
MAAETWHYLENQFETVTDGSRQRMNSLLADTHAKLTKGAADHAALVPVLAVLTPAKTDWDAAFGAWKDARAQWRSASQGQQNLLAALQEEPAPGERSKIDRWESKVGSEWAKSHPIYAYLFPLGRSPFTEGTLENILGEVKRLGERLAAKAADAGAGLTAEQTALLTALATEVTAFYTQLSATRDTQQQIEGVVARTADLCEQQRVKTATALYRVLAKLMDIYAEPEQRGQVKAYFDLTLIMTPPDQPDDAPETVAPSPVPAVPA